MFIKCPALFLNEKVEMFAELGVDMDKNDFEQNHVLINLNTVPIIFPSRDNATWMHTLGGTVVSTTSPFSEIANKSGFFVTRGFMKKRMILSITLSSEELAEVVRSDGIVVDFEEDDDDGEEDGVFGNIDSFVDSRVVSEEAQGKDVPKFEEISNWEDLDDDDIIEIPMALNVDKIMSIIPNGTEGSFVQMVVPYLSTDVVDSFETLLNAISSKTSVI